MIVPKIYHFDVKNENKNGKYVLTFFFDSKSIVKILQYVKQKDRTSKCFTYEMDEAKFNCISLANYMQLKINLGRYPCKSMIFFIPEAEVKAISKAKQKGFEGSPNPCAICLCDFG